MKGVLLMADIKKEQDFLNEVRNLTEETKYELLKQHLEAVNNERLQLMTKIRQVAKAGNYEANIKGIYEENIIFFKENGFFVFLYPGTAYDTDKSYIISWRDYKEKFSIPPTSYDEKRLADTIITAEDSIQKSEFSYIKLPREECLCTWLKKNGYSFFYDQYEHEYKIWKNDTRRIENVCN